MDLVFTAPSRSDLVAPWPIGVDELVAALESSKAYGSYFKLFADKIYERWGNSPDISLRIKLFRNAAWWPRSYPKAPQVREASSGRRMSWMPAGISPRI